MLLARTCLGCGTIVRGRSRCEDCSKTSARGYGSAWQRTARNLIALRLRCARCSTTTDLTVDHITPLSKGGTNNPGNLRVLCRPCNSGRSNNSQEF